MSKWENYRRLKLKVFERYMKAKKLQRTAEEWNILIRLGLHMKVFFRKRDELRAWKVWRMEIGLHAVMLTAKLKIKIRNQGGIKKIIHKRLRNHLTLATMIMAGE